MNKLLYLFLVLAIPKYFIIILINFLISFLKVFKKDAHLKNILTNLFLSFLISTTIFGIINSYDFSFAHKLVWSAIYGCFFFYLSQNFFYYRKNFVNLLKYFIILISIKIVAIYLVNIYFKFPITRMGVISPHDLNSVYELFSEKEPTIQLIYDKTHNISYLYLYFYYLTLGLFSYAIINNKNKNINDFLIFLLLFFASSYGSRSFIGLFFFGLIIILAFKKDIRSVLRIFLSFLIIFFNLNFMNENFINTYLKIFNSYIDPVDKKIKINSLNVVEDIDNFYLNSSKKRIEDKNLMNFNSRVFDNYNGFKAIILGKIDKERFYNYMLKKDKNSYFIDQKYFNNTYLNFFYLGNIFSFVLLFFSSLIILFYLLKMNMREKNDYLQTLFFIFLFFNGVMSLNAPFLTEKVFLLLYIFVCHSIFFIYKSRKFA